MTTRLKWKRKNDCGQTMSQCGRFWFVGDLADSNWIRLWHDDTNTLVGHYLSESDAKGAAQFYLDGLKHRNEEADPLDRDDGGPTDDNPVDEFTIDGARIVTTRALTQVEVDNEIWPETTVALVLENGIVLYASRDAEGNGPGALFGQYKDGACFQLGISTTEEPSHG